MAADAHIGADLALSGAVILACLTYGEEQSTRPVIVGLLFLLSWGVWRAVAGGWKLTRWLGRIWKEVGNEQ